MRLPTHTILRQSAIARRAIDRALNPDTCPYEAGTISKLEELREQCGLFRWAHPLKLQKTKIARLDRCCALLGGPLFTSRDHPWMSADGRLLEPIAQLDLSHAGAIGNVALGSGLLQLWMGPVAAHLRIIPSNDVQRALLTPLPTNLETGGFERRFTISQESNIHVLPPHAFVIRGAAGPRLSGPPGLKNALFGAMHEPLGSSLMNTISKLNRIIPSFWPTTEPHLFGNFDFVQYDIADKPPPLLALESGSVFEWGDAGNAQIFYDQDANGNVVFSAEYASR